MKVKTSELTGAALNWAVRYALSGKEPLDFVLARDNFSTCWNKGGPIIESMFSQGLRLHTAEFVTGVHDKGLVVASLSGPTGFYFGTTPLTAAMRCFVASKLGDEVDVPEELA